MWLRNWLRATENREQAIGNAEKLGDYHQQSIQIRNGLQKQIDEIKSDLATIKNYHQENEAVKLGIQAILRESIVSNYNKYKDRGYIPIYARESVKKIYEAYTDLVLVSETSTVSPDGSVLTSYRLREKTDEEKRLDALEEGQEVLDGAVNDLGKATSALADQIGGEQ